MKIKDILAELLNANLDVMTSENIVYVNNCANELLKGNCIENEEYVTSLGHLLRICNILYNRTDIEVLPVEDGVYDILLEQYKKFNPSFQVGSDVVNFNTSKSNKNISELTCPIRFLDDEEIKKQEDSFFFQKLMDRGDFKIEDTYKSPIKFYNTISKRTHDTKHNHPELVGTLDKCKFVLMTDAIEKGVENDSNVKVLERDFFMQHIMQGIISPNEEIEMVLELKYDGISVEADCVNTVESARTRGDTGIGEAADITPILDGYPFPRASEMIGEDPIGIKFEAIMTYGDLLKFNYIRNTSYKNCRTAIIGLFGAGDANQFRDFITLVPLGLDRTNIPGVEWNRLLEIEFLNKYYSTKGQPMRYAYIKGNYKECLFYIKKFAEEAEYSRNYLDFMYDGIVVSYLDENIRKKLGRKNYINKYSMAVKFNPLKKLTTFRGYTYTVGQNGTITPMIHYDQVEFFGTIHNKSTGNSYGRFKSLGFKIGDIVSVEYVNDVMPRVSRHNCEHNIENPNPVEEFITECPCCHTPLVYTEDSAFCPNYTCEARVIARVSNMMDKLNIKDFAEASLTSLGITNLKDLIEIDLDRAKEILGEVNGIKLYERMKVLKHNPIYDYTIIGALGFTGIAAKKWAKIFEKITLQEFFNLCIDDRVHGTNKLKNTIVSINGIGEAIANTIISEFPMYEDDIVYILDNMNVQNSKGVKLGKSIRCTGFRNKELFENLRSMGLDADDNASVTKSTDILLIPYEGFSSSKTKKIDPDITQVIPVQEFVNNLNKYI